MVSQFFKQKQETGIRSSKDSRKNNDQVGTMSTLSQMAHQANLYFSQRLVIKLHYYLPIARSSSKSSDCKPVER